MAITLSNKMEYFFSVWKTVMIWWRRLSKKKHQSDTENAEVDDSLCDKHENICKQHVIVCYKKTLTTARRSLSSLFVSFFCEKVDATKGKTKPKRYVSQNIVSTKYYSNKNCFVSIESIDLHIKSFFSRLS